MKRERTIIEVINLDEDKPKGSAWSKARELEIDDVIENTNMKDVIKLVEQLDDKRDQALFIILYLTAARIEEIVKYQKIKWGKKRVRIIKGGRNLGLKWIQDYTQKKKIGNLQDGIARKDINEKVIKGIPCVSFRIRNLKNRRDKFKSIPIRLDDEVHKKLWQTLKLYRDMCHEYEELFPFTKRNAERILNKIGWNPHSLRDLRLTHLVKYFNFSDQKLTKLAGWSDSRPSKFYIKLREEDLI